MISCTNASTLAAWKLSPTVYNWVKTESSHPGISPYRPRELVNAALVQGLPYVAFELTREACYNNGHLRAIQFVFKNEKEFQELIGWSPLIQKSHKLSLKLNTETEFQLRELANGTTNQYSHKMRELARLLRRIMFEPYKSFEYCYKYTTKQCELMAYVWSLDIRKEDVDV